MIADVAVSIALVSAFLALIYFLCGGKGSFRAAYAIVVRGFQTFLSYKMQIITQIFNLLLMIALIYIVGSPLVSMLFPALSGIETDYNIVFYFLIATVALPMVWSGYNVASQRIRQEQYTGTFEIMIASKNGVTILPFAYLITGLIPTLLDSLVSLLMFSYFFPELNISLSLPSLISFFAVVTVSILMMWGIGLFFGGLVTVYRQIGPIPQMLRTIMIFFGGVYFPVDVLPEYIQPLSKILPLTYVFDAVRHFLSGNATITEIFPLVAVICVFALICILGGVAVYRWIVKRARLYGTVYGY